MTCQIRNHLTHSLYGTTAALAIILAAFDARAAEPEMTNQSITDKIDDELMLDGGVPSFKIDVKTVEGVVTLSGIVNSILAKERAAKIAELVKGVRSVVNLINVVPTSPISDPDLKAEVEAALARDPATDSYEVTVEVQDGVVTLKGSVDSFKEKHLSSTVAKAVQGVRDLKNEIEVGYKYVRTDDELEKEVERALHWNVLVDDGLIDVEVDDGRVMLSGSVGSAAEKREARRSAWVAGVRAVDNSELKIADWLRDEKMRVNKYKHKPADEVRDAVKDGLIYDPRTYSLNVDIGVAGSTVTLRGTVDSLKAKRAAEQVARRTVGVHKVNNRLKVRTEEAVDDDKIETSIRRSLENDPWVDRRDISVSVYDGEAYLYGIVDNYFEKSQAEQLAARVHGVVNVRNYLTAAEGTAFTSDPYLDDPYHESDWYDYEPDYNLVSDSELKQNVEAELYWTPFVNEEDVNVEVDDRRVTLSGTVGSPLERRQAEMNAWQAGAKWVDNNLVWD